MRTHRDVRKIAIEAADFLKAQNPYSKVVIRPADRRDSRDAASEANYLSGIQRRWAGVCFRGQTGKLMLVVSVTGFDPSKKWPQTYRAATAPNEEGNFKNACVKSRISSFHTVWTQSGSAQQPRKRLFFVEQRKWRSSPLRPIPRVTDLASEACYRFLHYRGDAPKVI
jgi:hypothetical protein